VQRCVVLRVEVELHDAPCDHHEHAGKDAPGRVPDCHASHRVAPQSQVQQGPDVEPWATPEQRNRLGVATKQRGNEKNKQGEGESTQHAQYTSQITVRQRDMRYPVR
jgi:hypothetical protein